ncbi:hypothetical protein PFICI_12146 [Pestalotiopsis fici W106-1]|uniref:Nascent polypeptide-associated complex subunit alpha-like UBA domain-containing protein n=1 Tax=Pestalotiopsis fici (strain W106-1 / CGMCC3.15140) TaxID=1229662 RepID=W3WSI2_PESFW|nr:uncharacterized protein PFICI_12146 [Pestalotiopsis fici W106-1]ETS76759.1 hypothetical protein PFICI_12146 [Pestalotiopsis fici W106-1]
MSDLSNILKIKDKPSFNIKSTISQDRTNTEKQHQLLLTALERRPKTTQLKGGRFEKGIGKRDKGASSSNSIAKNSLSSILNVPDKPKIEIPDKDVELVMDQAGVSRNAAIEALEQNDGDIVNAIMSISV